LLAAMLVSGLAVCAQETPAPPPPERQPATPVPETPSAGGSPAAKGQKPFPGFLIIGTVFNERALSFPGVEIRVRREGERKYRWTTYTNSRGEFAVRVPEGAKYEVLVTARNFQEVTQTVAANSGEIQERLSIKLLPAKKEKTGAKP